jgi:hypothetical protein
VHGVSDAPPGSPDDQRPSGAATEKVADEMSGGTRMRAAEGRSNATQFVWLGVIAVLGAVWWWIGRAEPVVPTSPDAKAPAVSRSGVPMERPSALPASSEWAVGLQRREMSEVAKRRTQAARQLIQRQGLRAHGEPSPDWNAARLRGAIPVKAASEADSSAP